MTEGKELDALLDDLVRGKNSEEIFGKEGLVQEMTKRLVERALEGEMTAHLGYEKHASEGQKQGNTGNGRGRKRVKSGTGEMEIEVPRDRQGSFQPQLVRKRQRRLAGF